MALAPALEPASTPARPQPASTASAPEPATPSSSKVPGAPTVPTPLPVSDVLDADEQERLDKIAAIARAKADKEQRERDSEVQRRAMLEMARLKRLQLELEREAKREADRLALDQDRMGAEDARSLRVETGLRANEERLRQQRERKAREEEERVSKRQQELDNVRREEERRTTMLAVAEARQREEAIRLQAKEVRDYRDRLDRAIDERVRERVAAQEVANVPATSPKWYSFGAVMQGLRRKDHALLVETSKIRPASALLPALPRSPAVTDTPSPERRYDKTMDASPDAVSFPQQLSPGRYRISPPSRDAVYGSRLVRSVPGGPASPGKRGGPKDDTSLSSQASFHSFVSVAPLALVRVSQGTFQLSPKVSLAPGLQLPFLGDGCEGGDEFDESGSIGSMTLSLTLSQEHAGRRRRKPLLINLLPPQN